MPRLIHGEPLALNPEDGPTDSRARSGENAVALVLHPKPQWPFRYLFSNLAQDPNKLLPTSKKTVEALSRFDSG